MKNDVFHIKYVAQNLGHRLMLLSHYSDVTKGCHQGFVTLINQLAVAVAERVTSRYCASTITVRRWPGVL